MRLLFYGSTVSKDVSSVIRVGGEEEEGEGMTEKERERVGVDTTLVLLLILILINNVFHSIHYRWSWCIISIWPFN